MKDSRTTPARLVGLALALSLVWAGVAVAQPAPQGNEFQVNTFVTDDQGTPDVAADASSNVVVVWRSLFQDGDLLGIHGQRYDHQGNPVGAEFQVNQGGAGSQFNPAVAKAPSGEFVVTWTDGGGDGDQPGVFGRRFDSSGSPIGGNFQVNTYTVGPQDRSAVAMAPDGAFVVVWESEEQDGSDEGVFAQRYDATGTPVGAEIQVHTTTNAGQRDPDVAMDGDGDFVVVWWDYGFPSPDGNGSGIFGQRYDSAGNELGGEFQVNSGAPGYQYEPSVSMRSTGDFVVAWADYSFSAPQFAIEARRFDANGDPIGNDFQVNTTTAGRRYGADVGVDPDGDFLITWRDESAPTRVAGQFFDNTGTAQGGEFQVNTDPGTSTYFPAVVSNGSDAFWVTWQTMIGGSFEIAGRRYGIPPPPDADGDTVPDATDNCPNDSNTDQSDVDGDGLGDVCDPTDDSLVAAAPLDEGTGTTTDIGGGITGTLNGGATWVPGQQGTALEFDGSSGYVEVPDTGTSPLDITGGLTVALWVRPDALGGTQMLVSKDNAYEFEFGRAGDSVYGLRANNGSQGTGSSPVVEGVWQHLAVTWDGTTVRYYKNGVADGSDPFPGPISTNGDNVGLGARPSLIANGGPTFHLAGAIDDVRVYSRGLSAAEVANLFTSTVTDIVPPVRSNPAPDGVVASAPVAIGLDTDETATCKFGTTANTRFADLPNTFATTAATSHSDSFTPVGSTATLAVRCRDALGNTNSSDLSIGIGVGTSDILGMLQGQWTFEEGSGCSVADDTGNGQTGGLGNGGGTAVTTCAAPDNSPRWEANEADMPAGDCFSGTCLSFDGDDLVAATVGTELRSGPTQVTASAWVKHDPDTGFRAIVDLRGPDLVETDGMGNPLLVGFALMISDDSKAYFRFRGTTLRSVQTVDDGQWHHLVGVFDGSQSRIYIDGALDNFKNEGSASFQLDVTTQLRIGHFYRNDPFNFRGLIDTVMVYDRALNDLEVFDLYLTTRP